MQARSTSANFVHFTGDVTAGVDSSHGVRLRGGSTGGILETVSDDANAALHIRAAGTGNILIGNSSQSVRLGNSTSFIAGVQRYLVQYTVPALAAGAASAESTVTVSGLTTNSVLVLQNRLLTNSTGNVALAVRCSTADELTIMFSNQSGSTLSGSTQSGYLLQFRF